MEPAHPVQTLFITCLMVVITTGNLLNIVVIQKMRRVPTIPRYFMTSLAATDLGVGLLCIPFAIHPSVVGIWTYGDVWCQLVGCLSCTFAAISTYTLFFVGIERYVAVKWPLRSPMIVTQKRAIALISAIWIAVIIFCFALIDFYSDMPVYIYLESAFICGANLYNPEKKGFIMTTIAVVVIIPSVVMVYIYLTLAKVAWQHSKKIHHPSNNDNPNQDKSRTSADNWKAARMFIAVACAFMIAWFPYSVSVLYRVFTGHVISPTVGFCVFWLVPLNSFWNFLVYGVMNRSYRETAKAMLAKMFECRWQERFTNKTKVQVFEISDTLAQRTT
ncbi:histamine H2 receptor-like [Ptychodera flava]|uniref:histamine H2 receptor-like n=1 Tax=Ptychodera flava TaxID=63121 RepID=UPI00396A9B69